MKPLLSTFLILLIINFKILYPAEKAEYSIETSISRTTVTAFAVHLGTEMGRNWAVDTTSKLVAKTVRNPSFFFDWTIGSAVRGRTLLEAIPIAEKLGAKIGAITAAICVPIVFDFTLHALSSWKKMWQFYLEDKNAMQPSRKDFLMVGSNITMLGIMGFLIKNLKQ